jgi:RES domain-containing protein
LETLVHLDSAMPLPRFLAFPSQLLITDIDTTNLLAAHSFSGALPDLMETRRLGDQWLEEGQHQAFSVPSAIVPQESNLLLNPLHPRFARLIIGSPVAFAVDARLRR